MQTVRQGDLITVALSGDYGKPRPALVIQADAFASLPSATVLLITGEIRDIPLLRITIQANSQTGLRQASQIMVDKAQTIPVRKIGQRLGNIDAATLRTVKARLSAFLGLL